MSANPFDLFAAWYAEANAAETADPNAMTLATVDSAGRPSARIVLLKNQDPLGFVFYTNLDSRKARELQEKSSAALLFHWKSLCRQVRIEGDVDLVDALESDVYFARRDRESQIGAWASDQSRPLDSRDTFEQRLKTMRARFEGIAVPRPPYWGGYRLKPRAFEFWRDRANRLHERQVFARTKDVWSEGLLYP